MFFFNSLFSAGAAWISGAEIPRRPESQQSLGDLTDLAIDRALRDVSLPDGLITRLGKMDYDASNESADQ